MTNEIRTRHLIVTLPNKSGEEADDVAEGTETILQRHWMDDFTVAHVLGETLPDETYVRSHYADFVRVNLQADHPAYVGERQLSLYEARQLAGALLAIPGVATAEPSTACRHCGQVGHHADQEA